jgi:hypothetical protein
MIPAETGFIFLMQTKVSQKEEIWNISNGIQDIAKKYSLGDSYFEHHARIPLDDMLRKWEEVDYNISKITDQKSASRLYDEAYDCLIDVDEILVDVVKKESERLLAEVHQNLQNDLNKCTYLKVFKEPSEAWKEFNSYKSKILSNYFINRVVEIDPSTRAGREDVLQALEEEARTIFEIRDLVVPVSAQTRYKLIGGAIVAVITVVLGALTLLHQSFPATWTDIFGL